MHVLLIYYYVGSRVRTRVFVPVGTGVGVDFYPWRVTAAGLEFNPRVRVYISRTRG